MIPYLYTDVRNKMDVTEILSGINLVETFVDSLRLIHRQPNTLTKFLGTF